MILLRKKIWKDLWIKFSPIKDENLIKNIDLLKYNYTFKEYTVFFNKKLLERSKKLLERKR